VRKTTSKPNRQTESWVCGNELTQGISPLLRQYGYGINSLATTPLVPCLPGRHGIRKSLPVFAGLQAFPFSITSSLRETPFVYRFSTCVLPFLHSRPPWYSAFAVIALVVPGVSSKTRGCSGETDGCIKPAAWYEFFPPTHSLHGSKPLHICPADQLPIFRKLHGS